MGLSTYYLPSVESLELSETETTPNLHPPTPTQNLRSAAAAAPAPADSRALCNCNVTLVPILQEERSQRRAMPVPKCRTTKPTPTDEYDDDDDDDWSLLVLLCGVASASIVAPLPLVDVTIDVISRHLLKSPANLLHATWHREVESTLNLSRQIAPRTHNIFPPINTTYAHFPAKSNHVGIHHTPYEHSPAIILFPKYSYPTISTIGSNNYLQIQNAVPIKK